MGYVARPSREEKNTSRQRLPFSKECCWCRRWKVVFSKRAVFNRISSRTYYVTHVLIFWEEFVSFCCRSSPIFVLATFLSWNFDPPHIRYLTDHFPVQRGAIKSLWHRKCTELNTTASTGGKLKFTFLKFIQNVIFWSTSSPSRTRFGFRTRFEFSTNTRYNKRFSTNVTTIF